MLWKRSRKCPVKEEDKLWIETKLAWIDDNITSIIKNETIQPTKHFFNYDFKGEEEDADFLIDRIAEYFKIDASNVLLDFYSEESIELDRGLVTQTEEGTGSAGVYIQNGENYEVWIEIQQLKQTNSLISTIAHELSHFVLLGKLDFKAGNSAEEEEDEWLTDLLAICYGFGIFLGNTKFSFNQWQSGDGWGGWSTSTQGYLPQQIIAYSMAEIQRRKDEFKPTWTDHLKKDFKSDFTKSLRYLQDYKPDK